MKKDKTTGSARMRLSKIFEQKLQERSAVLYTRALEKWNTRPISRGE